MPSVSLAIHGHYDALICQDWFSLGPIQCNFNIFNVHCAVTSVCIGSDSELLHALHVLC